MKYKTKYLNSKDKNDKQLGGMYKIHGDSSRSASRMIVIVDDKYIIKITEFSKPRLDEQRIYKFFTDMKETDIVKLYYHAYLSYEDLMVHNVRIGDTTINFGEYIEMNKSITNKNILYAVVITEYDPNYITLMEYLDGVTDSKIVVTILKKTINKLVDCYNKYNFNHNDMLPCNLLVNKVNGDIKLFDFDKSAIKFKGNQIGEHLTNVAKGSKYDGHIQEMDSALARDISYVFTFILQSKYIPKMEYDKLFSTKMPLLDQTSTWYMNYMLEEMYNMGNGIESKIITIDPETQNIHVSSEIAL
jgi:serine/threonine protein kinase